MGDVKENEMVYAIFAILLLQSLQSLLMPNGVKVGLGEAEPTTVSRGIDS